MVFHVHKVKPLMAPTSSFLLSPKAPQTKTHKQIIKIQSLRQAKKKKKQFPVMLLLV